MKSYNNEVMLGAFILAAGGLLAYMSIAVGGFSMGSGVHVKAHFTNASGLVKDASIMVAGVEVGHIESLAVDHDRALVSLFLRTDAHIRADVRAAVRAKSLLGEKYLELLPQSRDAALIKDDDEIAITRATVEVDELLSTLGPLMKKVNPDDVAMIVHTVAKTLDEGHGDIAAMIKNGSAISEQLNDTLIKNRHHVDQIAANVADISREGKSFIVAKRPELERTVTRIDHLTDVLNAEIPPLAQKANRIASYVDSVTATMRTENPNLSRSLGRTLTNADKLLAKLPDTLDDIDALQKGVDRTLGKVNPLLDKANAIDYARFREISNEVLVKAGIKVYLHPFGPAEQEWQKAPAPGPTAKP